MGKNNHHFVPKLYLKAFQSAEKRIHLYNLKKALGVKNASLRDQCRQRKFYGATDDTENALSDLETLISPFLHRVVDTKTLPPKDLETHEALFTFVALQIVRTTAAANAVNVGTDKTIKQVYSNDPRFADIDMEAFRFGFKNAVLMTLELLPLIIDNISDLSAGLVFTPSNGFVTSDNPAFKYNQYCEQIQDVGTTGALSRGLQIFLPLAPNLQLILYDREIYQLLAGPSARFSIATQSDVDRMNSMQVIAADENVYFTNWQQVESIRCLVARMRHHREGDHIIVQEYGQDDDRNSSLLHEFHRTPCLKLDLSFMRVSRSARKVRLDDRARLYRKESPMQSVPEPPNLRGRTATFSRFIRRRCELTALGSDRGNFSILRD
jgi:hypothetical protein